MKLKSKFIFRSSRHSSTSSLADKSAAALAEAAISLDLRLSGLGGSISGEKFETPAPFPVTSQIGTGGLSRQGSLRKSGGETPSGSSPSSDASDDEHDVVRALRSRSRRRCSRRFVTTAPAGVLGNWSRGSTDSLAENDDAGDAPSSASSWIWLRTQN